MEFVEINFLNDNITQVQYFWHFWRRYTRETTFTITVAIIHRIGRPIAFFACTRRVIHNKMLGEKHPVAVYPSRKYTIEERSFAFHRFILGSPKCKRYRNRIPARILSETLSTGRREYVTCEDLADDNACYVLLAWQSSHSVTSELRPG